MWSFDQGVNETGTLAGWSGLSIIGLVAGLISGVAEALGEVYSAKRLLTVLTFMCLDVGSLDDNLTLPIVSGSCILGFFKFASWIGSIWTV